jgi:hypothetical protein
MVPLPVVVDNYTSGSMTNSMFQVPVAHGKIFNPRFRIEVFGDGTSPAAYVLPAGKYLRMWFKLNVVDDAYNGPAHHPYI